MISRLTRHFLKLCSIIIVVLYESIYRQRFIFCFLNLGLWSIRSINLLIFGGELQNVFNFLLKDVSRSVVDLYWTFDRSFVHFWTFRGYAWLRFGVDVSKQIVIVTASAFNQFLEERRNVILFLRPVLHLFHLNLRLFSYNLNLLLFIIRRARVEHECIFV